MKFLRNILNCLVVAGFLAPVFGMAMQQGQLTIDDRLQRVEDQVEQFKNVASHLAKKERDDLYEKMLRNFRAISGDVSSVNVLAADDGYRSRHRHLTEAMVNAEKLQSQLDQEQESKQRIANQQQVREDAALARALDGDRSNEDFELGVGLGAVAAPQIVILNPIHSVPAVSLARALDEDRQHEDFELGVGLGAFAAPEIVILNPAPPVPAVSLWFKCHVNWQRMVVAATIAAVAAWWFWKK